MYICSKLFIWTLFIVHSEHISDTPVYSLSFKSWTSQVPEWTPWWLIQLIVSVEGLEFRRMFEFSHSTLQLAWKHYRSTGDASYTQTHICMCVYVWHTHRGTFTYIEHGKLVLSHSHSCFVLISKWPLWGNDCLKCISRFHFCAKPSVGMHLLHGGQVLSASTNGCCLVVTLHDGTHHLN